MNALDALGDAVTHEQAIEVRLHGTARHVELARDFSVVATLKQELDDLLFARSQPDLVQAAFICMHSYSSHCSGVLLFSRLTSRGQVRHGAIQTVPH